MRIDIKFLMICVLFPFLFLPLLFSILSFLILSIVPHLFIIIICCILTVVLLSTHRCIDIVFCIWMYVSCIQFRYFSYFSNFSLFIDFLTMEPFRFMIWLLFLFSLLKQFVENRKLLKYVHKVVKMVCKWSRKLYHRWNAMEMFLFFSSIRSEDLHWIHMLQWALIARRHCSVVGNSKICEQDLNISLRFFTSLFRFLFFLFRSNRLRQNQFESWKGIWSNVNVRFS